MTSTLRAFCVRVRWGGVLDFFSLCGPLAAETCSGRSVVHSCISSAILCRLSLWRFNYSSLHCAICVQPRPALAFLHLCLSCLCRCCIHPTSLTRLQRAHINSLHHTLHPPLLILLSSLHHGWSEEGREYLQDSRHPSIGEALGRAGAAGMQAGGGRSVHVSWHGIHITQCTIWSKQMQEARGGIV